MSFAEVRLNDGLILLGTIGGPTFSTDVVEVGSGAEFRKPELVRRSRMGSSATASSPATNRRAASKSLAAAARRPSAGAGSRR